MISSSESARPSDFMREASTPRAPVGIVGAGFLGSALAAALRPAPVIATTRAGTWPGDQLKHVDLRALDLAAADVDTVVARLDGARALVLCYAAGRHQDRHAVYVDGTRRALAAARRLRIERLIYTSSTSALPDLDGPVDETCEAWPDDERGRTQREAEALVIDTCAEAGIPWFVLRLAGLYGPGRGLGRIYRQDPARVLDGDGMQATNLIHRDDAVAAILAALAAPPSLSALVHVCDDDHRPRRELFALVAAAEGLSPPRWEHPPRPRVVGKQVDNTRLRELLGVTLHHPAHVISP